MHEGWFALPFRHRVVALGLDRATKGSIPVEKWCELVFGGVLCREVGTSGDPEEA